jgi:hypothetical protein
MIQGHVKLVHKEQRKAIVRTEYDDLIILRILDGTKLDVGDTIVGALDCQGENFVLDHTKHVGVSVYIENGHKLFASAGRGVGTRQVTRSTHNTLRRAVA